MVVALHFQDINEARINSIVVKPPYERANTMNAWVRGNLRFTDTYGDDVVITGPKLRVCFSGCRWNKIVFSEDAEGTFKQWLKQVGEYVERVIEASPDLFKPGAKTSARFTFDHEVVKPSSDPTKYPDEIRARLSTHRIALDDGTFQDIPDCIILKNDSEDFVEPCDVAAGGYMIPILKLSYFRNLDRFGIVMTMLKALYEPPLETQTYRISNGDWEISN